ncbi:hypothetical protein PG996_002939 [Apiospora saccharicola]|uniref:Uncharacterized protein n=1 Tax=Apiospora saccharicola TaxID=335842 RepID=A0ABR1WL30_9PEZI
MSSTSPSFPQFPRLPAGLQLILGCHRDHSLVHRHHYIRSWRSVSREDNPSLRLCLNLHDNTNVFTSSDGDNDDNKDMADCLYANDGLASERILLGGAGLPTTTQSPRAV